MLKHCCKRRLTVLDVVMLLSSAEMCRQVQPSRRGQRVGSDKGQRGVDLCSHGQQQEMGIDGL